MASNSSEEHAKLNESKASLTKYVTAIKRDFGKNPKGVIGALIVLLLSCALSFAVAVNIATGNSIFGFAPRTKDHWNQRIELKGMELSQDQVIHGEKPVLSVASYSIYPDSGVTKSCVEVINSWVAEYQQQV